MLSLGKKNHRQAERAQTLSPNPPPWRSANCLSTAISKGCSISPSIVLSLSWGVISAPRTATATLGSWKTPASAAAATLTQQEGKKHKQANNPETLEKRSWESWSFGGVLLGFFSNPRGKLWGRISSLFLSSPHNLPVLSSMSASKPDCS